MPQCFISLHKIRLLQIVEAFNATESVFDKRNVKSYDSLDTKLHLKMGKIMSQKISFPQINYYKILIFTTKNYHFNIPQIICPIIWLFFCYVCLLMKWLWQISWQIRCIIRWRHWSNGYVTCTKNTHWKESMVISFRSSPHF